jgi:hypothetical protein
MASRYAFALITALVVSFMIAPRAVDAQTASRQDVSGTWQTRTYTPKIKPMDGGDVPFTSEGLTAYRKNIEGLKNGTIKDEARRACVPDGIPRILTTPHPFQVLQIPGHVTILYEVNHVFRNVLMDVTPASDDELDYYPFYSGTSYGRWDGDTLVIETRGFNEKTFIDATGVPHSDRLHVTERLRQINGGKQLEDIVTVQDPKTFTRPWSARFVYESRPEIVLETSYTCGEPHRDLSEVEGAH